MPACVSDLIYFDCFVLDFVMGYTLQFTGGKRKEKNIILLLFRLIVNEDKKGTKRSNRAQYEHISGI